MPAFRQPATPEQRVVLMHPALCLVRAGEIVPRMPGVEGSLSNEILSPVKAAGTQSAGRLGTVVDQARVPWLFSRQVGECTRLSAISI